MSTPELTYTSVNGSDGERYSLDSVFRELLEKHEPLLMVGMYGAAAMLMCRCGLDDGEWEPKGAGWTEQYREWIEHVMEEMGR